MKVFHVIFELGMGGAERALLRLAERQRDAHDVTVVALYGGGTLEDMADEKGVRVLSFSKKGEPLVRTVFRFYRWLSKNRSHIEVLHCWMYYSCVLSIFFPFRGKVFWGVRHSLYDLSLEKLRIRLAVRVMSVFSRRADAVIYNSEVARRQHERIGFSEKRGVFIPNGFDAECARVRKKEGVSLRARSRKSLGFSENEFVFVNIARNHPMKGQAALVRAFNHVFEGQRYARLVIVGRGVPETGLEREMSADVLDAGAVLLIDESLDPNFYLAMADFFVMSSIWGEGFPNVVAEASLLGVPSVCTDVGDVEKILGSKDFVVEPTEHGIRNGLLKACKTSSAVRYEIGERSRSNVIDNFSMVKVCRLYDEVYFSSVR